MRPGSPGLLGTAAWATGKRQRVGLTDTTRAVSARGRRRRGAAATVTVTEATGTHPSRSSWCDKGRHRKLPGSRFKLGCWQKRQNLAVGSMAVAGPGCAATTIDLDLPVRLPTRTPLHIGVGAPTKAALFTEAAEAGPQAATGSAEGTAGHHLTLRRPVHPLPVVREGPQCRAVEECDIKNTVPRAAAAAAALTGTFDAASDHGSSTHKKRHDSDTKRHSSVRRS
jgi:hypothetical protein